MQQSGAQNRKCSCSGMLLARQPARLQEEGGAFVGNGGLRLLGRYEGGARELGQKVWFTADCRAKKAARWRM